MDKDSYLAYCQRELLAVYTQKKHGKEDKIRMARLEGVIHAGQMLEIFDKAAARELIEHAHVSVFGYTRGVRDDKQARLNSLKSSDPDKYYDMPAFERLR